MRASDLLRLAWDNLKRNRTRSVLTGVGVLIGVAALLTLLAYGSGLQKNAQREFNALKLYNTLRVTSQKIPFMNSPGQAVLKAADTSRTAGGQVPLTDSLVSEMEALEGVLAAYPEVNFPAKLQGNGQQLVVNAEAIPQAFQEIDLYRPTAGRFFESPDEPAVLITPSMTERMGYPSPDAAVGDTVELITASLNFNALKDMTQLFASGLRALPMGQRHHDVVVAGILSEDNQPVSGFTRVLTPVGYAEQLNKVTFFSTLDLLFRNAETQEGYSAVRVQLEDARYRSSVEQKIREMGVYPASFQEQFNRLEQLFLIMDLALGIIGIIALIVATIGIANTVTMNVRERYREIGIMMAVGGESDDLQRLFVVESALLGALGGLAGLVFGGLLVAGLDWGVNLYLDSLGVPPITVFSTSWVMATSIYAGAVLISLAAGFFPARRAARIEPAEALRTV
jgi:putative ABC transport system permease protein